MSRKTLAIIILSILVLGSGTLYFIVGGKTTIVSEIINGSPFGTAPESSGTNGSGNETGTSGETTGEGEEGGGSGKPLAHLFRITDTPVAGAVSFIKNGLTLVRYVDRATGHAFDVNPATLEKTQILNTTQPKIYEALWKTDGSGFVARSVKDGSDTINNTSVSLFAPKASSTTSLYSAQATLLRGNIAEMAVGTDGSLLYDLKDTGVMALASFVGEKPKTLFTLQFTDWRIVPTSATNTLIYTKASVLAPGYAYVLNLSTGGLNKILGPLNGLTALLSPDNKRALYSYISNGSFVLSALNLSTKSSAVIFPATLPEKCLWSKKISTLVFCGAPSENLGASEPDLWYKGLTHFSDRVWKIDVVTNSTALLVDPKKDFGVDLDLEKPALSPNEDYLFFTNKSDLSLWALKLVP